VVIYSTVVNSKKPAHHEGSNFSPSGLAPTIVFAHTPLGLASFTNQQAVAHLPTGFGAGTYSLTVTNSSSQSAVFSFTLERLGQLDHPDRPDHKEQLGQRVPKDH
jgi:hypothetical protein